MVSCGRCRVENFVERRRSLRILAKQKFKEEQSLSQQSLSVEGDSKSPVKDPEVKDTSTAKSGKRGKGKQRKRKVSSSPSVSSPPKKRARRAKARPSRGGSKQNAASEDTESCAGVALVGQETGSSGESPVTRRQSKRTHSKEELCPETSTPNRERESVIVEASSVRKKRGRKTSNSARVEQEEQIDSGTDLGKKLQVKNRSLKSKEKSREKSKGKSRVNSTNTTSYYSLPSLVDFTKLNMASPE